MKFIQSFSAILICFLFSGLITYGQEAWLQGDSPSKCLSQNDLEASPQIKSRSIGPNKHVFVGNNTGVLVYNGHDWTKIQLKERDKKGNPTENNRFVLNTKTGEYSDISLPEEFTAVDFISEIHTEDGVYFSDKPMNDQSDFIYNAFSEWIHDHEQIDDICVMGVRV
jgi:hypothetical protein